VYFTGYAPIAITERITMLAIQVGREPEMIVPILERPDAEDAPSSGAVSLRDWTDGDDPYAATAAMLDAAGRYAISDSAWAMHVLGLQAALPESRYVSVTSALPLLRAIKGNDELERLAAAGAAADASLEEIVKVRFAGRSESDIAADLAGCCASTGIRRSTSRSSAPGRTGPTPITR
jgi:Xaa-Pro aminopeptidase